MAFVFGLLQDRVMLAHSQFLALCCPVILCLDHQRIQQPSMKAAFYSFSDG